MTESSAAETTNEGMAVAGWIATGMRMSVCVMKLLTNSDFPALNPPPMAIDVFVKIWGKATTSSKRLSTMRSLSSADASSANEDSPLAKAIKSPLKSVLNSLSFSFSTGSAVSNLETKSYFCNKASCRSSCGFIIHLNSFQFVLETTDSIQHYFLVFNGLLKIVELLCELLQKTII